MSPEDNNFEYLVRNQYAQTNSYNTETINKIKDIANMVGFKTVQHFNRIFKEITGTTPAEFRKTAVQKRKDWIK